MNLKIQELENNLKNQQQEINLLKQNDKIHDENLKKISKLVLSS